MAQGINGILLAASQALRIQTTASRCCIAARPNLGTCPICVPLSSSLAHPGVGGGGLDQASIGNRG